ncbi:integrase [Methylobacterium sp. WL9]|uniref:integrase n=1 Tax=Methylobacterium sp. WL9 TaxID=2603898 RepID=UPI0011C900CE|nr:integrase [Methylobacterium sp. WL9]TXN25077.1 integrase [Methylobacterium sp. WL9]
MPRQPDPKKAYLELHGTTWRVSVAVPKEARKTLGTGRLKHNLGTDSLTVANVLKRQHVERFKKQIQDALDAIRGPSKSDLHVALELGKVAVRLREQGSPEEWRAFTDAVYERHAEIRFKDARWITVEDPEHGPFEQEEARPEQARKADLFSDVAYGRATPIDLHHEAYLAQLFVTRRTKSDDERALKLILQWCARDGIPPSVERIDGKRAYAFADALKEMTGLDHVTLNKYIGRLSSYWQYLVQRTDAAKTNVFAGVVVKGPKKPHDQKERPFSNGELARLLLGPATPHMSDLMMIGALTGARLDAIVRLRVCDTANRCLLFQPQKSETTARYVPVHPDLAVVIARRTAGKAPSDDLFPEWPPVLDPNSKRERSFKASNHFTDYRRSIGVSHDIPGVRRSLVNFHSFRRWFISRLEQADVADSLIAAVVGHKRSGITLGVYSEGPVMRSARRAVAKVRLPPLDGSRVQEPDQVIARS